MIYITLFFPGYKGSIKVKRCHLLNLPDCSAYQSPKWHLQIASFYWLITAVLRKLKALTLFILYENRVGALPWLKLYLLELLFGYICSLVFDPVWLNMAHDVMRIRVGDVNSVIEQTGGLYVRVALTLCFPAVVWGEVAGGGGCRPALQEAPRTGWISGGPQERSVTTTRGLWFQERLEDD